MANTPKVIDLSDSSNFWLRNALVALTAVAPEQRTPESQQMIDAIRAEMKRRKMLEVKQ